MGEEIFKYLKKENLTTPKANSIINNWSSEKCIKFIQKCDSLISTEKIPAATDSSFLASNVLGGGVARCCRPECRVNKVDSLGRFTALYSDRVLIQNPFDKYSRFISKKSPILKDLILGDVQVLLKIKPLIENGLMGIATNKITCCRECLKKRILEEKDLENKIKKGEEILLKKYLDKINIKITRNFGEVLCYLSGPEEIIEHSNHIIFLGENNPLKQKYLKSQKESLTISNKKIKERFLKEYLAPNFDDLFLQDWYCKEYNYLPITNQKNDFFIRGNIETNKNFLQISNLMKGFNHCVPNLDNIKIDDLIKLRNKENESFKVYRNSLNEVTKKVNHNTTEEEVKELFESEIIPELDKLDLLIKKSRKDASFSFMKKAILGSGVISVGMFTGLIAKNFGAIGSSIGGYGAFTGMFDDLIKRFKIPPEVERGQYYFLWKTKNL